MNTYIENVFNEGRNLVIKSLDDLTEVPESVKAEFMSELSPIILELASLCDKYDDIFEGYTNERS